MATIRDIAKLAGVSQGTVSNVLNGKGIVSSEKIKLVESAAVSLGYTINERAKLLRQGKGKILAAILPNIRFRQYIDFYLSFKSSAESLGYSVLQYISNDDPETEHAILSRVRSGMVAGIAAFSCLCRPTNAYREAHFKEWQTLFVERDQTFPCNYLGFDYARCGSELATMAVANGLKTVAVVTGNLAFSNESAFYREFARTVEAAGTCSLSHLQTDLLRVNQSAIQLLASAPPEAVYISNYGFARTIRDVWRNFFASVDTAICTVSPIFTMPESDYTKYELNYRLLGRTAAKSLIANLDGRLIGQRTTLENTGIRRWYGHSTAPVEYGVRRLSVLTLDSPAAAAMRNLSRIYTQTTGIEVDVSVLSYDGIHQAFNSMDESSDYDILRIDVTWLSWFARKILRPLKEIDSSISGILGTFVDGLSRQYSFVEDVLYALPVSPSNQLLFYRKDLFESTVQKRLFQEAYRRPLAPPGNFTEYNQIARFFTRSANPQSPVDFGSTVTLGSTGVAGTEFLTRYFSHADDLFADDGSILLDRAEARRALTDLIELKSCAKPPHCAWWTNAAQAFADGNVAMTILYSNFASEILGRNSKVINKVGYAVVPGGNPIIGGGTLGVSKYSSQPQQALSYIRWMCSEPISSAMTLLGSVPVCRESFNNYEIVDTYPWLDLAKECFALSHYRRTPSANNAPFDERRFLGILGQAVLDSFHGMITPEAALLAASRRYTESAPALTARGL